MSDRAEVKPTYKFFVKQKREDRGPALRVTGDDHGQLGHLQRDLVTVLWPADGKSWSVSLIPASVKHSICIKVS